MGKTTVREVMHRGVITAREDYLAKDIARVMNDTEVHALIVVDMQDQIKGVISHMDILRIYGKDHLKYRARDLMTPKVLRVEPTAPLEEAVKLMLENKVHRLLVVESTDRGERPVGIISTTDIIRDLVDQPWFSG